MFSIKLFPGDVTIDESSNIFCIPNIYIKTSAQHSASQNSIKLWDFGDGTTVEAEEGLHQYNNAGRYTIRCTYFSTTGAIDYTQERQVTVVNPFDTFIKFTDTFVENTISGDIPNSVPAGTEFLAGEFYSFLSKEIEKDVPILCLSNQKNQDNTSEVYQHLDPTFNFYKDDKICSEILPEYCSVYVSLDNTIINVYIHNVLALTSVDLAAILGSFNAPTGLTLAGKIKEIYSLDEIANLDYYYIGKVGKETVNYRADIVPTIIEEGESVNQDVILSFVLDQKYFPSAGILNGNIINLVSITRQVSIGQNLLDSSSTGGITLFYSSNGLSTNENLSLNSISANKYSFNVAKYAGVPAPLIIRLAKHSSNDWYFTKDIKISSVDFVGVPDTVAIDVIDDGHYDIGSAICYLTFTQEADGIDFDINVTYTDGVESKLSTIAIRNLCCIDLNSFTDSNSQYYLDPKPRQRQITGEAIWNIYKTHDAFNDVPNLDQYMSAILDSNNFIKNVISKADNFTDDIANINTSNIKALVSLFKFIGLSTEVYDIDNFARPEIISKLLQIFSINHNKLIGGAAVQPDEFVTPNGLPGRNLGPEITINEGINGDPEWPIIVVYNKFANTYTKINTAVIGANMPLDQFGEPVQYVILADYTKDWGLGLLANNATELFQLYTLYRYIPSETITKINSYLEPETISENISDYNTWVKTDGSIDRLLYKTFIETLGLNKN